METKRVNEKKNENKKENVSDFELDMQTVLVCSSEIVTTFKTCNTNLTIYFSEFILFQIISSFQSSDSFDLLIHAIKAKRDYVLLHSKMQNE